MPVPEPDVCAFGVADLIGIQEEAELGLSGDAPALGPGVGLEIVVRGQARPVLRVLHRDGAIQGAHLVSRCESVQ